MTFPGWNLFLRQKPIVLLVESMLPLSVSLVIPNSFHVGIVSIYLDWNFSSCGSS